MLMNNRKGFTYGELLGGTIILGSLAIGGYGTYLGLSALNKYVNEPTIERANVIMDDKPELFIEKDGKRFYAEIDGKSIDEYLSQE
ncbi:hypothetical protein HN681_00580 [archaeon]|jgi:hypothetical protein|nr:hypothetical protein [archaeon]MBT3730719.1 hypothetical protein [archaeon]MBT4669621.1 hypothetical protein [archaeon]MBT5030378.1 hypothetical protein [archaeon]MBT5288329.1 hypothetical protein [archaeon]